MAQTGFTPIQLYFSSTTTNVPLAANLASGELAINITDGKLFYKDNASAVQVIGWKVVPATAGGTGQTSYAVGDLLYANTTTTLAKLPDVATGNALISGGVGVAPSYGKIGLTTHVSGTLPTANGGTNLTSFTANGVVYASSTSALATSANLAYNGTDLTLTGGNFVVGTSGKGIDFSATSGSGTSELLADYEEGTWTPTLGGSTTYLAQSGIYTKVGRLVYIRGTLYINAIGTGTTASLSGLPFNAVDSNPCSIQLGGSAQAFSAIYGTISGSSVFITYNAALATSNQTAANVFTALTYIDFSGCYSV
jgi:hypothetical protein